jgi:hypothetical protein
MKSILSELTFIKDPKLQLNIIPIKFFYMCILCSLLLFIPNFNPIDLILYCNLCYYLHIGFPNKPILF